MLHKPVNLTCSPQLHLEIASAFVVLGEREGSTARLVEAFAAYREALQELSRAYEPLYWASTQMNLGPAVQRLGERGSKTAKLEAAIAAYRDALLACKKEPARGCRSIGP